MGDLSKETTEEERDQSDEKRSEAMRAFSQQQFDEAIKLYTEAILLNPQSALLFAKRGQIDYDDQTNEWLQEVKPNAEKLRQHRLGAQRKKEEKE
ncbi:Hsc70-interacting protein 1, partial [Operophtera brumata]